MRRDVEMPHLLPTAEEGVNPTLSAPVMPMAIAQSCRVPDGPCSSMSSA